MEGARLLAVLQRSGPLEPTRNAADEVSSLQKVVIGQIHVKGSERPPVKVFWNSGAPFKINIHANSSGAVSVSQAVTASNRLRRSCASTTPGTRTLAFHGGVYNQIDYSETTNPEDGSVCLISDLSITHA